MKMEKFTKARRIWGVIAKSSSAAELAFSLEIHKKMLIFFRWECVTTTFFNFNKMYLQMGIG